MTVMTTRFVGRIVVTLLLSLTSITGAAIIHGDHQQAAVRDAFPTAARQGSAVIRSTPPSKMRDQNVQRQDRTSTSTNNVRRLANYYYNNNNNQYNNNTNSIDWSTVGLDISKFSVRYMGCWSAATYNAASVLQAQRYAVFRLCPSFYCNPYSVTGCDTDYGEYAVNLDTYLQAIASYNEDRTTVFCQYCSICNTTNNATIYDGNLCNLQACKNAANVCNATSSSVSVTDYLNCTAVVSKTNNNTYYLGPYCDDISYAVTVDVYSDSDCTNYIGDQVTVSDVLNVTFQPYAVNYLSKTCVTCQESALPWQMTASERSEDNGVSEICEVLYEDSVKCNAHYLLQDFAKNDFSYNDSTACNFIQNLINGPYNATLNASNSKSQADNLKMASSARRSPVPLWYNMVFGWTSSSMLLLACASMLDWV